MLDDIAPEVAKEAFIDDRALGCHSVDRLKLGIEAIIDMDKTMSHSTNIENTFQNLGIDDYSCP